MLLLPESFNAFTADVKDEDNIKILPCKVSIAQNVLSYQTFNIEQFIDSKIDMKLLFFDLTPDIYLELSLFTYF